MDVWVGLHYQPYGNPIPTFSTHFPLLAIYFCLSAAFELCRHSCLCSWAVTCYKELFCLKHHPVKSTFLLLPERALYLVHFTKAQYTVMWHKNEWGTVLRKYHKLTLAQIVHSGQRKNEHCNNPINKAKQLVTGDSKPRLHKAYWKSCPVSGAKSIVPTDGIGKRQV